MARPPGVTPGAIPTEPPLTPAVTDLTPPLVIDSDAGRLYTTGLVDGVEQIVALAASDGRLLATYGITGTFDVDPVHGWLYVDQADSGLTVLDAQTGAVQAMIPLTGTGNVAPQADPATGQALAFRKNAVHIIDPNLETIVDTIIFDLTHESCGSPTGPAHATWVAYDSTYRLLYLCFLTGTCTPHINEVCVSYDMKADVEITRTDSLGSYANRRAVAVDGYLYGSSVGWISYAGIISRYRWIWRDGWPWLTSEDWSMTADVYLDTVRGLLYESGGGFRVLDAGTLDLLLSVRSPVEGDLVGYDPGTDQLYFLSEGKLRMWSAGAIQAPSPEPPQVSDTPDRPVWRVLVSPAWPQDSTLFGIWKGTGWTQSGLLYLSDDQGATWRHPRGGLSESTEHFSALAVSPDYASDQTMLVGIAGMGVLRTTDGGSLWRASSSGMASMHIRQLLLSPGFEQDQSAFAVVGKNRPRLYHSTDGGARWESLEVDLRWVALSPEFDRDHTLMGTEPYGAEVLISRDGGDTWECVTSGWAFEMLSIAPQFEKWRVVFAYASDTLYRSIDGGRSWEAVLSDVPSSHGSLPQLVYGPEVEGGRALFLLALEWAETYGPPLVVPPVERSALYYSDNGTNWQVVELPPDIVATALAISPTFDEDRLLFVGTEDGRVVLLDADTLVGQ